MIMSAFPDRSHGMNNIFCIQIKCTGYRGISSCNLTYLFSFLKQLFLSCSLINCHVSTAGANRLGICCINNCICPDTCYIITDYFKRHKVPPPVLNSHIITSGITPLCPSHMLYQCFHFPESLRPYLLPRRINFP